MPATSEEIDRFFSDAAAGALTAQDVPRLYGVMLGREPDEGGAEYFSGRLSSGAGEPLVLREMLRSEEFGANVPPERQAEIREAFARHLGAHELISWFHSMPLPSGLVTKGERPIEILRREADAIFDFDVSGRSVLDIGAWDGFFSFEAEQRGAAGVLSTDHFCWSGPGWGTKEGYDFAHGVLGSSNRSEDVDVFSLDPEVQGRFDTVLFLGVLYHLKDPYGGLERAAAMSRDMLVVETETACNDYPHPVLRHFEGTSMNDDPTNFFAPNTACLSAMLREMGFSRIEVRRNPGSYREGRMPPEDAVFERDRHIVHARR